jgi:predicted phosphodiesterase
MSISDIVWQAYLDRDPSETNHAFYARMEAEGIANNRYACKIICLQKKKHGDVTPQAAPQQRIYEEGGESAYFEGTSEKVITTLEEAVAFTKVDMTIWEVEKWRFKSYDVAMKLKKPIMLNGKTHNEHVPIKRTNYAVQVWFKRRDDTAQKVQAILEDIKMWHRLPIATGIPGSNVGVVYVSDFHMGAEIKDLIRTPDFNIEILRHHLLRVADEINAYGFREVHVCMLGDYFESLSGLNHPNTFKSLMRGGTGGNIIRMAARILQEFLAAITNLHRVYMVAGNHDRITPNKDVDNVGEGADILAWGLQMLMPEINITYHPLLISIEIDGIQHVMTHSHHSIGKKDASKILFEYGNKDLFNFLATGHDHTRKASRSTSARKFQYDDWTYTQLDDLMYRVVTIAPIFTGNWFSESLGFSSRGGFTVTFNNGKGIPKVHDIPL